MNQQFKTTWSILILIIGSTFCSTANAKKLCCPVCSTPCALKVENDEEENHCWITKGEKVCIPRVRFSWQRLTDPKYVSSTFRAHGSKCCQTPLLGKSRTVCVLEKHTYSCPKCKYSWEPMEAQPCGNGTMCAKNEASAKEAPAQQLAKTLPEQKNDVVAEAERTRPVPPEPFYRRPTPSKAIMASAPKEIAVKRRTELPQPQGTPGSIGNR